MSFPLGESPEPPLGSDAEQPLRRRPRQQRSARRVQEMLDSCAALLTEVGYEGLTTSLIAERSGVAVGSLYQFFPDKHAVVRALALRNLNVFLDRVRSHVTDERSSDWWSAIDAIMDEYAVMHRAVPGFRAVHFGDIIDLNLLDNERDNTAVVSEKLGELLVERFDLTPGPRLDRALTVAVEAADAVLKLAFRHNPDGDPELIGEAKRLIRGYLSEHLPG